MAAKQRGTMAKPTKKDDEENNTNGMTSLEMEPLNTGDEQQQPSSPGGPKSFDFPPQLALLMVKAEQLAALARMHAYRYPRTVIGAACGISIMIIIKLAFFRHRGQVLYRPPHLENHFGDVQSYYDMRANDVHHWCLLGGENHCLCSDPTEPIPKFESSREQNLRTKNPSTRDNFSWLQVHKGHVDRVAERLKGRNKRNPDVVFIGDETIELMAGYFMGKPVMSSLQKLYNQSFSTDGKESVRPEPGEITGQTKDFPLDGLSFGITGDTSANVLWRLQNGIAPPEFKPKVFWLYVGNNDLTKLQCSEDVVSLGILRAAEEIARTHVGTSVVVVQGLLPQSPFEDGSLVPKYQHHTIKPMVHHHDGEFYVRADQIPLWPSIQAINRELETFCESHPHLVYFDAASIFLGSRGNGHYQESEKQIIKDLHDGHRVTKRGYEIMDKAIATEVKRIIYEKDERNFKTGGKNRKLR